MVEKGATSGAIRHEAATGSVYLSNSFQISKTILLSIRFSHLMRFSTEVTRRATLKSDEPIIVDTMNDAKMTP